MQEKTPHWTDRQIHSHTWIEQFRTMCTHRTNGDYDAWFRCVDGLVDILFADERQPVDEFMERSQEKIKKGRNEKIEVYRKAQRLILDTLQTAGYLSKQQKTFVGGGGGD